MNAPVWLHDRLKEATRAYKSNTHCANRTGLTVCEQRFLGDRL